MPMIKLLKYRAIEIWPAAIKARVIEDIAMRPMREYFNF